MMFFSSFLVHPKMIVPAEEAEVQRVSEPG